MRVLHVATSPLAGGYRSDSVGPWPAGESREVTSEVAGYLTTTFEGVFVVESGSIDLLDPAADADPVPARKRK